jgi:hypothetical protein
MNNGGFVKQKGLFFMNSMIFLHKSGGQSHKSRLSGSDPGTGRNTLKKRGLTPKSQNSNGKPEFYISVLLLIRFLKKTAEK